MRRTLIGAGLGLILIPGCAVPPPRGLVLVEMDTTRADHLSCYGFPQASTPALDRLAGEGLRFLRALTPAPATLPATSSLMTGRWPRYHGARYNSGYVLSPAVPTLAAWLQARGWKTGAFVSAAVLNASTGLSRGFDVYDDEMTRNAQAGLHFAERPGTETVERALAFVEKAGAGPFFLWVHLYEPHFPYEAPPVFAAAAPDPYTAEIMAGDAALAPLFERLRAMKPRPLLVFCGDHGEGLGEHGEETHGFFLHQSTLHVPLLFWGQGVAPGLEPGATSLVDIVPSVLARLGLEAPPDLDGRPLSPGSGKGRLLFAEAVAPEAEFGWSRSYAALGEGLKLVLSPQASVYNLDEDPGEAQPREFDGGRSEQARLRTGLREAYARPAADAAAPGEGNGEALRSLGYLGGGARREGSEFVVRDDPPEAERASVIRETVWLRLRLLRGGRAEAVRALPEARKLLAKFPRSPALLELVQEGEAKMKGKGVTP